MESETMKQTGSVRDQYLNALCGFCLIITGFTSHAIHVFWVSLKPWQFDERDYTLEHLIALPWMITGFRCLGTNPRIRKIQFLVLAVCIMSCGTHYLQKHEVSWNASELRKSEVFFGLF